MFPLRRSSLCQPPSFLLTGTSSVSPTGHLPTLSTAPLLTLLHPLGPTPQDLHRLPGARAKVRGPCDIDQGNRTRQESFSQVQRFLKILGAPKVLECGSEDSKGFPEVSELNPEGFEGVPEGFEGSSEGFKGVSLVFERGPDDLEGVQEFYAGGPKGLEGFQRFLKVVRKFLKWFQRFMKVVLKALRGFQRFEKRFLGSL